MISMPLQIMLLSLDERSFMEDLVRDYMKLMYSTAMRIVNSGDVAEDMVQDSLERLMNHTRKLMTLSQQRLVGYIVITVRNTALEYLNAQKTREKYEAEIIAEEDGVHLFSPSSEVILIERDDIILFYESWDSLPEGDRTILESKYVLGKSDSEIAKEIGCKAGSVRMKLTRAKRKAMTVFKERKKYGKN